MKTNLLILLCLIAYAVHQHPYLLIAVGILAAMKIAGRLFRAWMIRIANQLYKDHTKRWRQNNS